MSYKNLRVSYVYRVSSFSVYMDQNTGGSQSLCLFKKVSCFLHKDESIRTTKFFREASRLRVVFLFPSEWPRCSLDVSKLHEDQEIWKSFENYKVSHKAEIKHHYWLCWIWCCCKEIQASERWNALGQGFSYMIHFSFYTQLKTQLHRGVDYLYS